VHHYFLDRKFLPGLARQIAEYKVHWKKVIFNVKVVNRKQA